jgi:hypothetical protein
LKSPVALAIEGISFNDATLLANEFADIWINWVKDAKQIEARQRGAMNSRDDKLRQFAYRAAVAESSKLFGSDFGKRLGAGITGPIAEAYVGGGS